MNKVISELVIGKYKVLKLDEKKVDIAYTKYLIDGKEYESVPTYDVPNCIAVESIDDFVGKDVKYIR